MTGDIYQQAKAVFAELVDVDESARQSRLSSIESDSPELASEVRSLLEYHTAQSLVVAPATPKIRTRSTLSTTYQTSSYDWIWGPARGLMIAVPLFLLAVLLSVWVSKHLRESIRGLVNSSLNETIDNRLIELRQWESREVSRAVALSQHPDIVQEVREIISLSSSLNIEDPKERDKLAKAAFAKNLEQHLNRLVGSPVKFAVWDRRMSTVADWNQDNEPGILGSYVTPIGASMLAPVLKGNAKMFLPTIGKTVTEGYQIETTAPVISIFVPVCDLGTDTVIAALMVRGYGLEEQYQTMLETWSSKTLGEIYLLNSRGALITESRYGELLDTLGLAYDESSQRRIPLLKDPGADLLAGESSDQNASIWPPTLLAGQVALGNNGVNVDGYRNYVGQQVVGAWRWLPEHEIGIAIEQDYNEAFGTVTFVRNCLLAASGIFSIGLIGMTIAVAMTALSRRKLLDVSEVGPYQIHELLGEGGMGRVYLAEHALLCRQSAIKVLTKGVSDLSVISRFEREVQLASQLTHPNTISIFDFGRNKDGIFYYAMEYINGAHLGQLVEFAGPIQPGRVIYILRQLCRALSEAHMAGVVHRDVKPQNIMVCNRGGEPDFVKLFDYGLVKAFAPGVSHNPSQTKVVVGTPRFMAPERLNSPWLADPRVDIYSVGSLAYFLLTGQLPPLVTLGNGLDSEQPGVETLDLPPSVIDFGGLLSVCMAVEPSSRPSSMVSLLRELDVLSKAFPWEREDSLEWWEQNEEKLLHLVRNKRKKLETQSLERSNDEEAPQASFE